nr:MAG TPA_asm: hypothetical protein [Bacteriophage sp.]DAO34910.1 MAG TPA: hypothetical protein [Caudoviricetes sp.]DAT81777.1 MAG TPA: hypothetical protein [Caudoviricetes sp.]DAW87939.1 MAG TPA: hypothetical protein [Bacteriophage sp.]DAX31788.1 MAG TPA: hypothetical protein [Bacteriophage sp.]
MPRLPCDHLPKSLLYCIMSFHGLTVYSFHKTAQRTLCNKSN